MTIVTEPSATAIELRGLSKTYMVSKRKKVRSVDTNTFAAFFNLIRGSFSKNGKKKKSSVHYVHALSDIDLDIYSGEVLGIIGRNGAGKSTLLKVLARVVNPSGGHARIRGRVVSLLELGLGFDPYLTVRENIYLYGQLAGMSGSQVKNAEESILEFSDLTDYRDEPLISCPGGSYVRLAFATMMGIESDIILADEVLAVGDAKFRSSCEERIRNVAKTGETVLFVSHDMDAIKRCCSRVVWIDNGRIRQVGEPNDVVSVYQRELLQGQVNSVDVVAIEASNLADAGQILDLRLASSPGHPVGAAQLENGVFLESLVRLGGGVSARIVVDINQGKQKVMEISSDCINAGKASCSYSVAVRFPEHFFNEAKYVARARLEMTLDSEEWVRASSGPQELEFLAMNTNNTNSVWNGWQWGRPGLLSPKIDWIADT